MPGFHIMYKRAYADGPGPVAFRPVMRFETE